MNVRLWSGSLEHVVSEPPVVAITDHDLLLHIAPAGEVVAHVTTVPEVALADWSFFDATGHPLTAQTDDEDVLVGFAPTSPGVDPTAAEKQLLIDRIDSFLARAQVQLDAENVQAGPDPEHVRVPRVTGDLPDVITGLAAIMTVPGPQPDVRDWLHNLGHRLGFI